MSKAKTREVRIEGMNKAEALTTLIRGGMDFKEAEEYWKANSGTRSAGFAGEFYSLLEKGPMDDEEFENVMATGSNNVQKHRSHYNSIRSMANSIWAGK